MSITPKYESEIVTSLQFSGTLQGRIQDFKLGTHLKKLRRAEVGAKIFGVGSPLLFTSADKLYIWASLSF